MSHGRLCIKSRSETATEWRSLRTGRTRSRVERKVASSSATTSAQMTATEAVHPPGCPASPPKRRASGSMSSTARMLPPAAKAMRKEASVVRSCASEEMTPSSEA